MSCLAANLPIPNRDTPDGDRIRASMSAIQFMTYKVHFDFRARHTRQAFEVRLGCLPESSESCVCVSRFCSAMFDRIR